MAIRALSNPGDSHTPDAGEASAGDAINDLVSRAQLGQSSAFEGLYEHFYGGVYRYVYFKVGNPTEAEDLTEEVFLRLLESIHTFRWQGRPFSAWLYRIARNLVVDHFRKRGRERRVPLDTAMGIGDPASVDLDAQADVKMTMVQVRQAMANLSDLQREVISLRFDGGLSVLETAEAVGRKQNAVKALQHAGIKKLRRLLTADGKASTQPAVT